MTHKQALRIPAVLYIEPKIHIHIPDARLSPLYSHNPNKEADNTQVYDVCHAKIDLFEVHRNQDRTINGDVRKSHYPKSQFLSNFRAMYCKYPQVKDLN